MTLTLDSNVLIDLGNGDDASVRRNFVDAKRRGERLHVSPQALHEVAYGALISSRPLHHSEVLHRVLADLLVEPFTAGDSRASAQIRAERRRLGKPIGVVDAMIAGQALARGWAVITADRDDFDNIPGLAVVNWRSAATNTEL